MKIWKNSFVKPNHHISFVEQSIGRDSLKKHQSCLAGIGLVSTNQTVTDMLQNYGLRRTENSFPSQISQPKPTSSFQTLFINHSIFKPV